MFQIIFRLETFKLPEVIVLHFFLGTSEAADMKNDVEVEIWYDCWLNFFFSSWIYRLKKQYSEHKNIAEGIMFIAVGWLPSFQVIYGLPALAYFEVHYQNLRIKNLPPPRHWWLLVAWFLFTLCCSLLGLDEIENHCENQKLVAVIFYRIHKYLNFISTLICMFLVGVSVEYCFQKFKKEHHVTDYKQALKLTDELTKEYRALKKGISPLLFLLLSPTVGSLITYTYTASVQFSNEIWVGAYILKLTYVCYIMEDCYEAFSSIPLRIR